jgi:hypothetical protein
LQDPLARCTPLRRRGWVCIRHDTNGSRFGLDSPKTLPYVWTVESNREEEQ